MVRRVGVLAVLAALSVGVLVAVNALTGDDADSQTSTSTVALLRKLGATP